MGWCASWCVYFYPALSYFSGSTAIKLSLKRTQLILQMHYVIKEIWLKAEAIVFISFSTAKCANIFKGNLLDLIVF